MNTHITVIGIGEEGLDGLPPARRHDIEAADVLAGGARHLALVPDFAGPTVDWTGGIDAGLDAIAAHLSAGRAVVVLASGDPMDFGVGRNVVARFGAERVRIHPHPGAVSLTCAAVGWSRPDVQVVTVHGRPLDGLRAHVTPGRRLVVLSENGETPGHVARLLDDLGYGPSHMAVCEHLGGPNEHTFEATAEDWDAPRAADLNTIAVEVRATDAARPLTRLAGLPDDAYDHDGQLTKRHARAVTLSSLAPVPGETLWDLGAGAGSIAIEWLRAHDGLRAVAVERDPVRAARIRTNAHNLGVPRLDVRQGDALVMLDRLDGAPDAVFVGGGVGTPGLLDRAWARLKPGGRLVANAVTEQSHAALQALQNEVGGELTRIAIADKAPLVQYVGHKPKKEHT